MRAFVINLDRAPERWLHMQKMFTDSSVTLCRVSAIDGNSLQVPHPNFNENGFRMFHGRKINIYEVACYFSHLKAMEAFLETDDEHAMIAEDDIFLEPDFEDLLPSLIACSSAWNILRLTGLSKGSFLKIKQLTPTYSLVVHLGRLKGAGAYLIDRKTAKAFTQGLLPMWLPWDHAFDREWVFHLKALAVAPFPISQTDKKFRSAIQESSQDRLPARQRWATTYPYQIWNECSRWICRLAAFRYRNMRARGNAGKL